MSYNALPPDRLHHTKQGAKACLRPSSVEQFEAFDVLTFGGDNDASIALSIFCKPLALPSNCPRRFDRRHLRNNPRMNEIGSGVHGFECVIWNSKQQQDAGCLVWSDVPSLTALNSVVRREIGADWAVISWALVAQKSCPMIEAA